MQALAVIEQNKLELYEPHTKQLEIHALKKAYRAFMAGNRVGKTWCGSMETAYHLTGLYPSWWTGLRFDRPTNVWAATDTFASLRNALIPLYLGGVDEADYGKGSIPKHLITKWTMSKGVSGVIDYVRIKHVSGGESTLIFKSYDQGRQKFQGAKIDFIHLDEEPDIGIFSECAMRIATTGGGVLLTMTPLLGMSDVCMKFLDGKNASYGYVQASWEDNPHLSPEDKVRLEAGTEPHLLEARSKGIPAVGSGKVYPVLEKHILVDEFQLPDHFRHVYGLDFGWNNTAVVFAAIDDNTDTVYLYDCYKQGKQTPEQHSANLTPRGIKNIPGVCDPSKGGVSQTDGVAAFDKYVDLGLNLTVADNTVNTGVMTVLAMMNAGTIKVFDNGAMQEWLREFRMYGRDEKGKIKKEHDHLMDATRYVIMSGLRLAKPKRRKNFVSQLFNRNRPKGWAV